MFNLGEAIDYQRKSFLPANSQAVCAYTLDQLLDFFQIAVPNHLKIDVDSNEKKVFQDAYHVIRSPHLKSILVEMNDQLEKDNEIIDSLNSLGFELTNKHHAPCFDGGDYASIFNDIFTRKNECEHSIT